MLATVSEEFGEGINARLRRPDADEAYKLDVLTRLHARACQIAQEVIVLLSAGLADGAMARWRTLHEVATAALLISENGEALAERYARHDVIESRRAFRD